MTSPGFLLTKKLLQDSSELIEELELGMDYGMEDFIPRVVQDLTFPRLKILKLRDICWSYDVGYEDYMKAMLSRAPNLEMFHSNSSINSLLSVLKGSSVQPVYGSASAPFDGISEDVISAIKFEEMSLECPPVEFDFERFYRITPMLLQQCCTTTLRSMTLEAVLAIPLMTYGIQLENVKNLRMEIDYDHLERIDPRILQVAKNFDFTRIFPNLNKADIGADDWSYDLSPDHINAIIDRANAVLGEPMLDRASGIKELVLHFWYPSSVAAQFFVEMFPNVQNLEIETHANAAEDVPFGSIWNWLELKDLKIRGDLLPRSWNLDSVFCGLFPEEVAELRLKDDEYLKKVNIVPVMPAVTCLTKLRTLSLYHKDLQHDPFGDHATFMFSKVTALIAFARQPALAVNLKICARSAPPAMAHLKPYASVTSELLKDYEDFDD